MSTHLEMPLVPNGHSQSRTEAEGWLGDWCVH